MSARQPRWEVVRTDAGWLARFRSSNGNVIVSTETYARKAKALRAIELVTGFDIYESSYSASGYEAKRGGRGLLEIRFLDERTPEPPPLAFYGLTVATNRTYPCCGESR